jgi:uroporphyrinogen-III synthase
MPLPLAGKAVLIARPRRQAQALAERIRAAGGEALVFPVLEIEPVAPDAQARAVLSTLGAAHLAVFISANAVEHGLRLVRAAGGWPATLTAVAVGAATASALRAQGVDRVLVPEHGADSEALLALPEMQSVGGQRIVIFRGVGGRELLADTLRSRGAQVAYVQCYRRGKPALDVSPVTERLRTRTLHAVVAASGEALANLVELLPDPALLELPLCIAHPNVARTAHDLGFRRVQAATGGEAGLLDALIAALRRHD